ncbi:MAG: trypsin-like peptidase domain-containing protein, partial [Planctomycetes bacterium]|nr:trypsin-like peptidase domain-containing protein [Planctomycetota bacterium]
MNRRHVVWVAVVVGSLLGSGLWPVAAEDELSEGFVKAAERIAPSVVAIRVTKKEQVSPPGFQFFGPPELRRFFRQYRFPSPPSKEPEGEQGMQERRRSRRLDPFNRWPDGAEPVPVPRQGMGSGVILTQDGHIVTNGHVVKDAQKIEVLFLDGESAEAQLVGTDPKSDLAVIKVDTDRELTPARLASSDHLRVGQWVLAVGSPFGLTHSVSAGIISGLQRNVGAIRRRFAYEGFIQTDADINQGSSGGPLVNLEGEVVGICIAIASDNNLGFTPYPGTGFAIPANRVRDVTRQLIDRGKVVRGFLG